MASPSNAAGVSYVEWGAVIAGTVLATALSFILLQFGSGLGLSFAQSAKGEAEKVRWLIIISGLWLLWVQVTASMIGGYLAGRMRRPMAGATAHENEVRDGTHGLLVWATGTVVTIAGAAFVAFLSALAPEHAAEVQNQLQADVTKDFTRTAGLIFGFATAAISLVSGAAAWWAGTVGGDHRDEEVDFSSHVSFRTNKKRK